MGLLLAVVVLLSISVVSPWWYETEVPSGPNADTSTQTYSPLSGVTGTCATGCSPFFTGPPVGPVQGTHSFGSLGLNETAILYDASLSLVVVGLAGGVATLAVMIGRPPRDRRRFPLLGLTLVATVLASGLPAALQPVTLRADVATFLPNSTWTAAPSPETSFWGSCTPGPWNGVCSSGWATTWGPDAGWYMIAVAGTLLVVVSFLLWRKGRVPDSAAKGDVPVGP
jgi:hypothetical protein